MTDKEKKEKIRVRFYDPRHLQRFQTQYDSIRGALKAAEQRRDDARETLRLLADVHHNRFESKVQPVARREDTNALLNPAFGHATIVDNRLQREAFPEEFDRSQREVARAERSVKGIEYEVEQLKAREARAREQLDRVKRFIVAEKCRSAGIIETPAAVTDWGAQDVLGLPTLSVGEVQEYVDARRQAIETLARQIEEIKHRPQCRGALIAAVDDELSRCATTVPANATIEYAASPAGSARNLIVQQLDGAGALAGIVRSIQPWLFLEIHGDRVRKALMRRIDEFYEAHGPGLSDLERAEQLAMAKDAIRTQNILEEYAIRAGERAGLAIERRLDADCEALIGPLWWCELEPEKLPLAAGIAPIGV